MSAVRALGAVLKFLLELGVYASVVQLGWGLPQPVVVRTAAALLGVVVMAGLWARFAAPRAQQPLTGAPRAAFEAAWFLVGVLCLAHSLGWLATA